MATGQILKDDQFYGGVGAKPMQSQQDLTQPLPKQVVSDQSFLGTPNKPKIATTATPVVSVNPKPVEASGFIPGQLGNIDTMGVPDIQDYVDYLTVRGQKQALTETEQRELLKAQRKLATQQVTAVNPYTEQIQATEAERQKKEADLRKREQALVNAEEQRLKAYYDQQARKTEQAGQKQQEAAQSVLSFGGFGRSTVAAEQQASIQQSINEAKAIQEAERNASLERYRAQQAGATAEDLAGYDQRISQLKQQNAQYIINTIEQANAINQQTAQSYQEKIDNILALSASFAPTEPLTDEEITQAKSYAQLAIDQDGNINEAFVKMIPARLLGDVMKEAAIVKGARPGASKEFGFINAGQGVIAVTDPTTGEITFAQGPQTQDFEFKTAGDQAFAFNPQTGQVEQITTTPGTLEGIGNGKVTAYGTGANPYGLDVDGRIGDPIVSKVGGQVVETGSDPKGYGNYVIVQDAQGNKVRYAHTQSINVKKGDTINAGQQIATVGNSGYTIPGPGGDGSHVDITLFGPDGKEKGAKDVETYLKSAVDTGETIGKLTVDQTDILKALTELESSAGFSGAVGGSFQKFLPGRIKPGEGQFIPGTPAASFERKFSTFRDLMTLPNLSKLKGPMSDKDIQFLRNSATSLSLDMPESEFKEKLEAIKKTLIDKSGLTREEIQAKMLGTPVATPATTPVATGQNQDMQSLWDNL